MAGSCTRNRVLSTCWNCGGPFWRTCLRTTKASTVIGRNAENIGATSNLIRLDVWRDRGHCFRRSTEMKLLSYFSIFALVLAVAAESWAGDAIPNAAWRRPLGLPLNKAGVTRVPGNIDDGYWQGAPVGGFGSGTFSRSYRGDFARWHIKAGVHKYVPVYSNQFAMFQETDGEPQGTARVLMTDHPCDKTLGSWQWDYPVGAGEYAALYPKSWYA